MQRNTPENFKFRLYQDFIVLTIVGGVLVVFPLLVFFPLRLGLLRLARAHKLVHEPPEGIDAHRQREVVVPAGGRFDHLLKVGNQIPVLDVEEVGVLLVRHAVLRHQIVLELPEGLLEHPVALRGLLAIAFHLADLLRDEILHQLQLFGIAYNLIRGVGVLPGGGKLGVRSAGSDGGVFVVLSGSYPLGPLGSAL